MIQTIILCQYAAKADDGKLTYFFAGLIGSLIVSLALFWLNHLTGEWKRRREIKERLRNELIATCDKLTRFAVQTEYCTLTSRYYYTMSLIDKDDKFMEVFYLKYHNKAEDSGQDFNLCKTELQRNAYDLLFYWGNKTEADAMIKFMEEIKKKPLRQFDGIYAGDWTKVRLTHDYLKDLRDIERYIVEEGVGVQLIGIKKILNPHTGFI